MNRSITPAGLSLLKQSENCTLVAFQDQGKVWTNGWGQTGPDIVKGTVWTQEEADTRLAESLVLFQNGVQDQTHGVLDDNEFSAVVCFAYNEGLGTLQHSAMLKLILAGEMIAASAQFPLYNKVRKNGKLVVSDGLTIRRHNEQALFLTDAEQSAPPVVPTPPEAQTSVPAAPLSVWRRLWLWL